MTLLDASFTARRGDFRLRIELVVDRGETVAIVGPNGSGKSTAARALAGLEQISNGRITLDGRHLDDPTNKIWVPPHQRNIGMVFQDALLFPHLDVAANVAFSGRHRSSGEIDDQLGAVGLSGAGERRADSLSGGQARRVAIARALIGAPTLVILDEPFAGLDVGARTVVRRVLRDQLGTVDAARILITHDPADAQTLADRVIVVENGRVTQTGTPDEIRRRPNTAWVADLVGLNLLRGRARDGMVAIDDTYLAFAVADRSLTGPVSLTMAPQAISLYADRPVGSPRNAWPAVVGDIHRFGDIVRVQIDAPVPLVADVTPGAVDELDIAPGRSLWVAIKATSIEARAD